MSGNGDTEELEALFDSIADVKLAEFHADGAQAAPAAAPAPVAAAPAAKPAEPSAPITDPMQMYQRIGQLTRELHNALRDVGADRVLERAAREFPDAADRLEYVARLTEQAAEKTLNAVEIAQSRQSEMNAHAVALSGRWEKFFGRELSLEEFRGLAQDTRMFCLQAQTASDATNAQLHEIMMAQDFQDLTGQVIQKLTKLANEFESNLLRFLIDALPPERREELQVEELAGPNVKGEGAAESVTNQAQVDDLLESLGF
jgi:chemotaxis protein CheZ